MRRGGRSLFFIDAAGVKRKIRVTAHACTCITEY